MKKRVSTILFFACVSLVASSRAQDASRTQTAVKNSNITAEEVLEKHIAAIGGRERLEKSASYTIKAKLEMPGRGVQGTIEIYGKAPNRLLSVTDIQGIGLIKQGYDGQTGWSQDPYQGPRTLEGDELERARRGATFNAELKWRSLYEKAELAGTQKLGERETYIVRLTPKGGGPVTSYYDTQTFMLLRTDATEEGPAGKISLQTHYADYRDLDGVKVSFQWTQKSPIGETVIKVTEAKNNIEIADAIFTKPANAKP